MENAHLWKYLESFYERECEIAFLFFKTKSVTQLFTTYKQAKI